MYRTGFVMRPVLIDEQYIRISNINDTTFTTPTMHSLLFVRQFISHTLQCIAILNRFKRIRYIIYMQMTAED